MYRVKKANGWNKYKVQKRFMFIFWFSPTKDVYDSRGQAEYWCNQLNCLYELERLL
jgi:hypothetical protein